jgi:hypothetical protein
VQLDNIVDEGPEVGPEYDMRKQGAESRVTIRIVVIVAMPKPGDRCQRRT